MNLNIVLLEPEIPDNTASIGRTCVAAGSRLHLIEPLGFQLTEKRIKRVGMDYWNELDLRRYVDFHDFLNQNSFLDQNPKAKLYMATTKAKRLYTEQAYEPDAYLMFGKESAGIPEEILVQHPDNCMRIPMMDGSRSLNLSTSVAIVLYEALRQNLFLNLKLTGKLHYSEWPE